MLSTVHISFKLVKVCDVIKLPVCSNCTVESLHLSHVTNATFNARLARPDLCRNVVSESLLSVVLCLLTAQGHTTAAFVCCCPAQCRAFCTIQHAPWECLLCFAGCTDELTIWQHDRFGNRITRKAMAGQFVAKAEGPGLMQAALVQHNTGKITVR